MLLFVAIFPLSALPWQPVNNYGMKAPETNTIGTKQKALAINLDPKIYGSFAEIGAGQDVAANFFKAGGSSGTIAKTMSAYDMVFSDAIYGAAKNTPLCKREPADSDAGSRIWLAD